MTVKIVRLALSVLTLSLLACAPFRSQASRDQALIRAAEKGHTELVTRLIKAGADVNARDRDGWTPYLAASTMGHFEAMQLLKSFGAKTIAPELTPEQNVAHRYLIRPN